MIKTNITNPNEIRLRAWERALEQQKQIEQYGATMLEFLTMSTRFNKRIASFTSEQRIELQDEFDKRSKGENRKAADAVRLYEQILDEWDTTPVRKADVIMEAGQITSVTIQEATTPIGGGNSIPPQHRGAYEDYIANLNKEIRNE